MLVVTGTVMTVFEKEEIQTKNGSFTKQYLELAPDNDDYPLFLEAGEKTLENTQLEDFVDAHVTVRAAVYSKMTDDGRVFNSLVIYNIDEVTKSGKSTKEKSTEKTAGKPAKPSANTKAKPGVKSTQTRQHSVTKPSDIADDENEDGPPF